MNFFVNIYIIFLIPLILCRNNPVLVIKPELGPVSICSVAQEVLVTVNNTGVDDVDVELNPDECCLEIGDDINCDVMMLIGCRDEVPKGTTKTLKMFSPALDPFERHGYCNFYVDSKRKTGKRNIMRDFIRVNFDTRVKREKNSDSVRKCKRIDQDPLNDCKPVNCDIFYNGERSYYDQKTKRCIEIPPCADNFESDIPEVIYDPVINRCVQKSITKDDIDTIKGRHKENTRIAKDILIINNESKNKKTNSHIHHSLVNGMCTVCKTPHYLDDKIKKNMAISIKDYIRTNKCTLIFVGLVISFQCCVICGLVYYLKKTCVCHGKDKVVRKFYNYRNDASVTTPLINTSNVDTETDYQYMSESSNIDKKIKCYKACQKERNIDMKLSMSDDILSKCLNRRAWVKQAVKSEVTANTCKDRIKIEEEKKNGSDVLTDFKRTASDDKDYKSNFETHLAVKNKTKVYYDNEAVKKTVASENINIITEENKKGIVGKKEDRDTVDETLILEKEIKCHSYDRMTDFNVNTTEACRLVNNGKLATSLSTEKETQAVFPNDSIDDFLSERGMLYLAGDNFSKYTFSTDSNSKKPASTVSSKTSKNNILKTVLSLFKKTKSSSSEPGVQKEENLDLEVIHMSHASLYSSSNNGSECLKGCKRVKESRSSF